MSAEPASPRAPSARSVLRLLVAALLVARELLLQMPVAPQRNASQGQHGAPPPDHRPPAVDGDWLEGRSGPWVGSRSAPADAEPRSRLGDIGYAKGFQEAGEQSGVTVLERERVQAGLKLCCSEHGHEAFLIELDAAVRRRSRFDYGALPDASLLENDQHNLWRRVELLPEGDLLAIYGGRELVRVDRGSNVRWFLPQRAHRDLGVGADEVITTLTHQERRVRELNTTRDELAIFESPRCDR